MATQETQAVALVPEVRVTGRRVLATDADGAELYAGLWVMSTFFGTASTGGKVSASVSDVHRRGPWARRRRSKDGAAHRQQALIQPGGLHRGARLTEERASRRHGGARPGSQCVGMSK